MNKAQLQAAVDNPLFYRGCYGKRQYPNKKVAAAARKQIGDMTLNVYRCDFCRKVHLGHSKWPEVQR